jgi:DNA-3-methyladenine glycosylase
VLRTDESALPPLPRDFFARPTELVAEALLGTTIVRRVPGRPTRTARIVEVEAYLGVRDLASHARRGPTPRASIMFGPPGHLYVYLIYGMYHCMNFVAERDGEAGAVLIRAAEPLRGFDEIPAGKERLRLLAGPGKLCRALGVTLADKGLDLTDSTSALFVAAATPGSPPVRIARSARIGVDYAGAWARRALRFYDRGSPSVSGPRHKPARAGIKAG